MSGGMPRVSEPLIARAGFNACALKTLMHRTARMHIRPHRYAGMSGKNTWRA